MDILGIVMCVASIIVICVDIWLFTCAVSDASLSYSIAGIATAIVAVILIICACRLDSYIKGTVVDIMPDKIIIMEDDDTTWEYRVNKYITQKYKIGDTIEIYNDDNVDLLK